MEKSRFYQSWTWHLASAPDALWPLVSDTDRFNRDCGFPPVEVVPRSESTGAAPKPSGVRRLRTRSFGLAVEWNERPFEWIAPFQFGVERFYSRGPLAYMRVRCELSPRDTGGTALTYQTWITPANAFWQLGIPIVFRSLVRRRFGRVFQRYGESVTHNLATPLPSRAPSLAPGAAERLQSMRRTILSMGPPAATVDRLTEFIASADDLSLDRMRPYAFADRWQADRTDVLRLFLHAARAGLLDFRWEVLCPGCRGAAASTPTLAGLSSMVHCDSCQIDFSANFEQSVEMTFSPNPAVRPVGRLNYCVGGPQITPHIVARQEIAPGELRRVTLALAPGHYRFRSTGTGGRHHLLRLLADGPSSATIDLDAQEPASIDLGTKGTLEVLNRGTASCHFLLERLAWSDQASTAAEVTALQLFRDLFSSEVLRHGEQISVGSITLVFTDLKGSTQMYREIGDAPAFGRVMTHFDILKSAVAAENGALVKTMGDAVMAVFPRPVAALRAMLTAQSRLSEPGWDGRNARAPLFLKAGLHQGPCIAINQNERLDYFGTTVNLAARLCGLCSGSDLVLSSQVRLDPEVSAFLKAGDGAFSLATEAAALKGFTGETFAVWRIKPHT